MTIYHTYIDDNVGLGSSTIAGIQTNGSTYGVGISSNGYFSGIVTASSFVGDGAKITGRILNSSGNTILNQTGSILQVVYEENTSQFVVNILQSYQVYYSVNVTAIADNSKYFLNGFFTGFVIIPAASPTNYARSNIGYSVTISGSTTRILGVDGVNGDSWSVASGAKDATGAIGITGALHNRPVIYTSTAPAGTVLTFNLLAACYDYQPLNATLTGYGQKSAFTIMEISA